MVFLVKKLQLKFESCTLLKHFLVNEPNTCLDKWIFSPNFSWLRFLSTRTINLIHRIFCALSLSFFPFFVSLLNILHHIHYIKIRVVFLYWLPCILRMSRPTPEEDEEKLDKKAQQLQSVELKERWVYRARVCVCVCLSNRKIGGTVRVAAWHGVARHFQPRSPCFRMTCWKKFHFIHERSSECGFVWVFSSSKSLLANVLDIDDDFRCNHSCPTFLQQPTYYRTVYRYLKVIFIIIYFEADAVLLLIYWFPRKTHFLRSGRSIHYTFFFCVYLFF